MFRQAQTRKFTPRRERLLKLMRRGITGGNIWLLKISRGRIGNSFLGTPTLLLTTIGRKSGQPRTLPLYYMEDGGRMILVASNAGTSQDPAWLLNIRAQPTVAVQVRGQKHTMLARIASEEEQQQLWPRLIAMFPWWQMMAERSQRAFPIVVLERMPS
jgi:F420H(2)-dependent quinone reductase